MFSFVVVVIVSSIVKLNQHGRAKRNAQLVKDDPLGRLPYSAAARPSAPARNEVMRAR